MKKWQQSLLCFMVVLVGILFLGRTSVDAEEVQWVGEDYTFQNDTIKVYKNSDGIALYPVQKIVESAGYVMEECARCGKDEIYNKANEDADGKGHYFVNWYQAILSYSVSDQMVELSAANEKIDGVTYGPIDLFDAMGLAVTVNEQEKTLTVGSSTIPIVYFYSSTCDSCERMEQFLSEVEKKYPHVSIKKYNIYETVNYDLLVEYGKVYDLPEEKRGYSPSVYISDQVLLGEEIRSKLTDCVEHYNEEPATTILDEGEDAAQLEDKNVAAQILSAIGFGLVNGLNPCGLSMFLFLLSLLVTGKDKMMRCGIGFLAGKAGMFFLLGTFFYNLMNKINATAFSRWMDGILIIFVVAFAVLNIVDFFQARSEKYEKMKLQLPGGLKKLNHRVLKWGNRFTATKWAVFIMIVIGMVVATGEFLCTGQIYLSSIVMLVQKGTGGLFPMLLLAIYSVAFVLPLLILMIVIFFGKKVFGMSEFVLEKIPLIKLISALLFIAMAVYMILT